MYKLPFRSLNVFFRLHFTLRLPNHIFTLVMLMLCYITLKVICVDSGFVNISKILICDVSYDSFYQIGSHIIAYIQCYFVIVYINPLTAGAAYIRAFIFYKHIKYHLLNMFKMKCDINQQYLKTVDLQFVKSE